MSAAQQGNRRIQGWILSGVFFLVALTLGASAYTAFHRGVSLPPVRSGLVGLWAFRSNTGSGAPDSVGDAEGRILNPVWVESRGYLALQFDGESTAVEIHAASSIGTDGSLSLAAWVKPETVRDRQVLVVFYRGSDDEDLRVAPVAFYAPWGNGRMGLVLYDGDRRVGFLSDETIRARQWQHVAVTLDGETGRIRFYVDGVVAGERETTVIPRGESEPVRILLGSETSELPGRFGLRGDLDSISLYDRELAPGEIETLARGQP